MYDCQELVAGIVLLPADDLKHSLGRGPARTCVFPHKRDVEFWLGHQGCIPSICQGHCKSSFLHLEENFLVQRYASHYRILLRLVWVLAHAPNRELHDKGLLTLQSGFWKTLVTSTNLVCKARSPACVAESWVWRFNVLLSPSSRNDVNSVPCNNQTALEDLLEIHLVDSEIGKAKDVASQRPSMRPSRIQSIQQGLWVQFPVCQANRRNPTRLAIMNGRYK